MITSPEQRALQALAEAGTLPARQVPISPNTLAKMMRRGLVQLHPADPYVRTGRRGRPERRVMLTWRGRVKLRRWPLDHMQ